MRVGLVINFQRKKDIKNRAYKINDDGNLNEMNDSLDLSICNGNMNGIFQHNVFWSGYGS